MSVYTFFDYITCAVYWTPINYPTLELGEGFGSINPVGVNKPKKNWLVKKTIRVVMLMQDRIQYK